MCVCGGGGPLGFVYESPLTAVQAANPAAPARGKLHQTIYSKAGRPAGSSGSTHIYVMPVSASPASP